MAKYEDRTKEAFEQIEQGVKDVCSSDNFKNYLKFLSKFHQYSFNNTMLILGQYPSASLIAGYNSWKNNFNRQVNKGEHAIKILAPYQIKIKQEKDQEYNEEPTQEEVKVTRFHLVNVFDISQTTGDPIPEFVTDLKGTSHDAEALIQAILDVATIEIQFIEQENDVSLQNGAKGYYSPVEDKIVVNSNLDTIQKAKTLVHEYAHSILHKQTDKSREQKEIEAESLAFVICNHFNIDTSDYSFGYIAAYANQNYDKLRDVLVNIQANAHELIEKVEPEFNKYRAIIDVESKYMNPIEREEYASPFINAMEEELLKTGLYDYLTSKEADTRYGREYTGDEIYNCLSQFNEQYPGQCYLFEKDYYFKQAVIETIYQHFHENDINIHPFIDASIERMNYEALENIASPILGDDVYYMKFKAPHALDFNIEKIGDGRIAMSHYYELNGDLMADPDVEILVNKENKLLIPQTYQMDSLAIYQTQDSNPQLSTDLNVYLNTWIDSIKGNYYKVNEIKADSFQYNIKDNYLEMKKYCKENSMKSMFPKKEEPIK